MEGLNVSNIVPHVSIPMLERNKMMALDTNLSDDDFVKMMLSMWDDMTLTDKLTNIIYNASDKAKAAILHSLGTERLAKLYKEIIDRDFLEVTGVNTIHVKFIMETIALTSLVDELVNKLRDEWRASDMVGKARYKVLENELKGIYHCRTDLVKKCIESEEIVVSIISRVLPHKFWEYLYTKDGGTQFSGTLYYTYYSDVVPHGYKTISSIRKGNRKIIEQVAGKDAKDITMGSFIAAIYVISETMSKIVELNLKLAKEHFVDSGIMLETKNNTLGNLIKSTEFQSISKHCRKALSWMYGGKFAEIDNRLKLQTTAMYNSMDGLIPVSSWMKTITKVSVTYVDFYMARLVLQYRANEKPSPNVREDITFLMEMNTAWMLLCKDLKWLACNTTSTDVQDLIEEIHDVLGEGQPEYDEKGMMLERANYCYTYVRFRDRAYQKATFKPNTNILDRFNRRLFEASGYCKNRLKIFV